MVTRQTKRGTFSTSGRERVEQTAQQAGIADGFAHAAALGPQVLALQQSLLAGIVQSQQREAKRLAKLYGEEDARIGRAVERAAQVQELNAEASRQGTVVNRVVQTFQEDGIFHGYVHQADGTEAVGYTVKLDLRDTSGKRQRGGSAKTDGTAYFHIDLTNSADIGPQDVPPLKRWTDRLARLVSDEVASAEQPEATHAAQAAPDINPTTGVPGDSTATSNVQVLDPSGRVVFEDPAPPTFESMQSEFRYYVLIDASSTRTKETTGKKPASGTRR